ncbi:ATP F0F1 synthase synthase [Cobetia amphilecti]|nr:ATP F0F1 synthase synthase [Cobetia amphilecti]
MLIDTDDCVDYDPDHNLDEDSWFKIESFSNKEFFLDYLEEPFNSTEYDNLRKEDFSKITYMCSVQNSNYYFQKVTKSSFVNKKMMMFGDAARIESSDDRIVIRDQPDAIYYRGSDVLVFKNLATISSIFKKIDMLYKEATAEEVTEFLESPFLSVSEDFSVTKVSTPNRKRISLAVNTLEQMDDIGRGQIMQYIQNYCEGRLNVDEQGSFCISSDVDLKYLLYGIEQRFYTTVVGEEKRLANSVRSI